MIQHDVAASDTVQTQPTSQPANREGAKDGALVKSQPTAGSKARG